MVVNSSAMGFNPMSAFGAFNPFAMQFGFPQQGATQAIGGLFGGIPRQAGVRTATLSPEELEQIRWQNAGGYNSGIYDIVEQQTGVRPGGLFPSVSVTEEEIVKPRRDRTYSSGGIGKYAAGQYEIPNKGMPNFGKGYLNTGLFGAKGQAAIKDMGYADQAAYLAANPNLVTKYERKNPTKTVKSNSKEMIRQI